MNPYQCIEVDLAGWRAWRKKTFDCDHDSFSDGRPFYEVTRDNRGNVLVEQGMMSHWMPMRFVRYAKQAAS